MEANSASTQDEGRSLIRDLWDRYQNPLTRVGTILVVLGIWQLAIWLGSISPMFLCGPGAVVAELVHVFADGSIWPDLWATGSTALLGFSLALVIGIPVGIAMGRVRLVRNSLEPLVMATYASPTVAFLPLLILWLGLGLGSRVALVFLGAVFTIVINTEAGVSSTDRRLIETARAFCATESDILLKVIAPAALPFILAGCRLAVGRVLIMVVVAEMYASTAGIGYMIFQAAASYDTASIFAGVVILATASVLLNAGMRRIETAIVPWQLD